MNFSKLILTLAIGLLAIPLSGHGQDRPLSCDEIFAFLKKKMSNEALIELLQQSKTDCDIERDTDLILKLLGAGGNVELLDAMRQHKVSGDNGLGITAPQMNAEVGATVRVDGYAEPIRDKHLWIFAKREGLKNWWPQGGEIELKPDGTWRQGVFIGAERDKGYDFNIIVQWIDQRAHQEMNDYVTKTAKSGHYYPIPLPDGSPKATLVVHKVGH